MHLKLMNESLHCQLNVSCYKSWSDAAKNWATSVK